MKHGDDKKRFLIRRVCDQVIVNRLESQRSGGQIRAEMALVWELYQLADRLEDIFTDAPRGGKIVLNDKFPDFSYIRCGARVKFESLVGCHFGGRRLNSSSSRRRNSSKNASPSRVFKWPLWKSS